MQRTIISTLTLALSHFCLSRRCSGLLRQRCSPSPSTGPCSWENMLLEHVRYNMWLSYAMPYYAILCCAIRCHTMLYYAILCCAILCHTMLYYVMLYYAMLYYTMSYCAILYYVIIYYAVLYSVILCHTMLCYTTSCYTMLCYAMLCYAMLCYAMLCYAMLCYAMLCYAMLCYAMLCYANAITRHESITETHSISTVCAPFAFASSEYAFALLWPTHPFADRAATYFLTKTLLELPVTLVQMLVQFIMCYNMIGLQVLHRHCISKTSSTPTAIKNIGCVKFSHSISLKKCTKT